MTARAAKTRAEQRARAPRADQQAVAERARAEQLGERELGHEQRADAAQDQDPGARDPAQHAVVPEERKPAPRPPRSLLAGALVERADDAPGERGRGRQRQRVERERVRAADARDEHAAGDRADHEADVAGARAHGVGPHELVAPARGSGSPPCEAERYGDCAIAPSAASPISTVGACTNTSARLTTAPAAVRADHDDAAVEAVAEHARERRRQAVGADHGEQRRRAPDGRMGPPEDERHERHEGDLAAGHGEHAADREAVDCGLVWESCCASWRPCGQGCTETPAVRRNLGPWRERSRWC